MDDQIDFESCWMFCWKIRIWSTSSLERAVMVESQLPIQDWIQHSSISTRKHPHLDIMSVSFIICDSWVNLQEKSVAFFWYERVGSRAKLAAQAINPRENRLIITSLFFKGIWSFQIVGMGIVIITISTTNINTPWYISISNKVSALKHFLSVIVESHPALTGLHWRIRGIAPEIVRAIKKTMTPYP